MKRMLFKVRKIASNCSEFAKEISNSYGKCFFDFERELIVIEVDDEEKESEIASFIDKRCEIIYKGVLKAGERCPVFDDECGDVDIEEWLYFFFKFEDTDVRERVTHLVNACYKALGQEEVSKEEIIRCLDSVSRKIKKNFLASSDQEFSMEVQKLQLTNKLLFDYLESYLQKNEKTFYYADEEPEYVSVERFLSDIGFIDSKSTTEGRLIVDSFIAACNVKKLQYKYITAEIARHFSVCRVDEKLIAFHKKFFKKSFNEWLEKHPKLSEKYSGLSIITLWKFYRDCIHGGKMWRYRNKQ